MVSGEQIYGDGINVDGAKTLPPFSNARQFKNGCDQALSRMPEKPLLSR
jgi:hypothetical protein